jgi:DNA-binding NarL/FixJ family response regulator
MSDSPRVRVFVVEDNLAIQKALLKSLTLFPELEVLGSEVDGESAVERILQLQPDLVLLDLELPSLHGREVTRRIKARKPEIEILILTTFDDAQSVFDAVQAGASGYLTKRAGPEKIRAAIAEVMAGGTVLEPRVARKFWTFFESVRSQAPTRNNPWKLTPVELDVLGFVAKGLSNAEVGHVMTIERRTVRTHLSHIYRKMGVSSHVEAVVLALREGLVEL